MGFAAPWRERYGDRGEDTVRTDRNRKFCLGARFMNVIFDAALTINKPYQHEPILTLASSLASYYIPTTACPSFSESVRDNANTTFQGAA